MSLGTKILKLTLKSVLIISGIVVLLVFLAGYFGGAGIRDFEKSIINDYEYVDTGGYEKMIINREGVVIDSRVDDYKIVGDKIIVARRPVEIYFKENQKQTPNSRLSANCEYWEINIKTHRVDKLSEAQGLHCN